MSVVSSYIIEKELLAIFGLHTKKVILLKLGVTQGSVLDPTLFNFFII